ncbi:uncharacterized protein BXZ73DRAFT_42261 [Epithele typhae]|uniref:uncharacterized protein n=1 Tax=Epithele typhae TaxID=378194 RepID=UPI002007FAFE|nr:uncharacterized protein BXZ73DRAFT_42261 [Epithele typhae]KAH9941278.1 hypothetical protein BXZ73DRAFT_42261 [Epithele typhae]
MPTARALSSALKRFSRPSAGPEAKALVSGLLKQHGPLSNREMWHLVSKTSPETSTGDNTSIPSMRYLKHIVLEQMGQSGELVKRVINREVPLESNTHATSVSPVKTWRWDFMEAPTQSKTKPVEKAPYGAEVGVGEDFSHLNKRRQRSRVRHVTRDVSWMKELDEVRRIAAERDANV